MSENKTVISYTIKIKDSLFVDDVIFRNNNVVKVMATKDESDAYRYSDEITAKKIAKFVDGTILKHTKTTVVTRTVEEIEQ